MSFGRGDGFREWYRVRPRVSVTIRRPKQGIHIDVENISDCFQGFKIWFAATCFVHTDGASGYADFFSQFLLRQTISLPKIT